MGLWEDFLDEVNIFKSKHERHIEIFNELDRIGNLVEIIYSGEKEAERKKANDELLSIFPISYLKEDDALIIRENNKSYIKHYEAAGLRRKSGRPAAIHGLLVEYFLALNQLPIEGLFAGTNHDWVEDEIAIRKSMLKHGDIDSLIDPLLTDKYIRFREISKGNLAPKTLAKAIIVIQKLTRFESDTSYQGYIDRISDENISENTLGLKGLYSEYKEETGIDLDLTNNDINEIISLGFSVKPCDRGVNTIDAYDGQPLESKISDVHKNRYVLKAVSDYLKRFDDEKKIPYYKAITDSRDLLIHVNKKRENEKEVKSVLGKMDNA